MNRVLSPTAHHRHVTSPFHVLEMSMMGHKGPGTRAENQDRVLQRWIENGGEPLLLIAVADGVSCCPHGGEVASYLIEQRLAADRIFEHGDDRCALQARKYLRDVNERFYAEFADDQATLESACTLSTALIEGTTAHCEWVGDSPIFLARKKAGGFVTTQLSVPDNCGALLIDCFGAGAPFRLKHCKVELGVGDMIIVASDGVARGPESFGALLNAHGATTDLLAAVEARAKSSEFYDDASFVLAQRIE